MVGALSVSDIGDLDRGRRSAGVNPGWAGQAMDEHDARTKPWISPRNHRRGGIHDRSQKGTPGQKNERVLMHMSRRNQAEGHRLLRCLRQPPEPIRRRWPRRHLQHLPPHQEPDLLLASSAGCRILPRPVGQRAVCPMTQAIAHTRDGPSYWNASPYARDAES